MSFAFDFLANNTTEAISSASTALEQPQESTETTLKRPPFVWLENFALPPTSDVIYAEIEVAKDQTPLRYCEAQDNEERKSDLVPRVYEGGLKVWECSVDLVHYLAQQPPAPVARRVWEMGCGHALPSCYLLQRALLQQRQDFALTLTDFNDFVVSDVTLTNLWLNVEDLERIQKHVSVGYGDWLNFSDRISEPFDLILAAETVYSTQTAEETALLLSRHLSDNGIGLVATKRYYFGVGGGSDAFQLAAEGKGLVTKVVKVLDNGRGNIREIFQVSRQES